MTDGTTLWLVRHAETATPGLFHGAESDVGLSARGRRQADAAAAWYAGRRPTAVVSSGMRRAVDTAAPIAAACGVPHVVEPELHERRVGALSGTAFALTEGPWADTVRRWTAGDTAYTTDGAESFDELRARLIPAWERVATRFAGERVVVVAHGVVCKVLLLSVVDGRGPADWHAVGRVLNLAGCELRRADGRWVMGGPLAVPETVAALAAVTGEPPTGGRSEG